MASKKTKEKIVVLDFGAQYAQLIARRIRECRVYSEIIPCETPLESIVEMEPSGIVLSGGQASVYEDESPTYDPRLFDTGIPMLGICYGMQLMAHLLGGTVKPAGKAEYGKAGINVLQADDLFKDLNPELIGWMSHGDFIEKAPSDFDVTAQTTDSPVAAMADRKRKLFGVLFHPEVSHTPWGIEILRNFVLNWCGCSGNWTSESFIQTSINEIREQIGQRRILCGLSGGVDSTTTAVLTQEAVGDQLQCILVNHGFMRLGEPEEVESTFRKQFNINLVHIDASHRFLSKLKGITDPEDKRKIIGEEFIRVFEDEARKLGRIDFLAQGTLYPDVIESGTRHASRIKTHHNVGGLPEKMDFELVEPLRLLFKDEVRAVAEVLGISPEMAWRHPFPGPGLAIRILGEVTEERLDLLRNADSIIDSEIKRWGLYRSLWQSFAVLIPIGSTGVKGDKRTYGHTIALRAVESEDGMTADWARLDYRVLESISNRICNEIEGINRFVYDVSSKPPATIEWE